MRPAATSSQTRRFPSSRSPSKRVSGRLDLFLRPRKIIKGSDVIDMLSRAQDGVLITVRVVPRSGRAGLAGTRDRAVLVRLNSAPVDGAANAELIELIAEALGVPKRAVSIASGLKSRSKTVHVAGVSENHVRTSLIRTD